jgi:hypothetical protein
MTKPLDALAANDDLGRGGVARLRRSDGSRVVHAF